MVMEKLTASLLPEFASFRLNGQKSKFSVRNPPKMKKLQLS
jgi:hypothetical protein